MPWTAKSTALEAAEWWVSAIRSVRQAGKTPRFRQRYYEVRYEDLVADPEPTLKELFMFLDEPWDPVVLDFHRRPHDMANYEASGHQVTQKLYTSAVGRWQRDLSPADRDAVKQVAGALLIELGYANDYDW